MKPIANPDKRRTKAHGRRNAEILADRIRRLAEKKRRSENERILVITRRAETAKQIKRILKRTHPAPDAAKLIKASYIGTVYEYCSRAIKKSSLRITYRKKFFILSRTERRVICQRLLGEHIGAGLRSEGVSYLVSSLGIDEAEDTVLSVYDLLRRAGKEPSRELIPPSEDPNIFLEAFDRSMEELKDLIEENDGFRSRALRKVRSEFKRAHSAALELLSSPAGTGFDWNSYQAVKSTLWSISAFDTDPETAQYASMAGEALGEFMNSCLDRQSDYCAGVLLDLVSSLDLLYSSWKNENRVIDDLDVLLKGRDLILECPDKFKHVILEDPCGMDEIHAEIIGALSADGAEVTSLEEETGSRRGITDFINRVFETLSEDDIFTPFGRLRHGRGYAGKSVPDVELMLLSNPAEKGWSYSSPHSRRRREAEAVAKRILQIAGDKPLALTKKDRNGCFVTIGDITVLTRFPSNLDSYKAVFREYGIPTAGGRGIYQSSEAREIYAFLKVLRNPYDDPAMVSVLLSPFAGVSRNALIDLAKHRGGLKAGKLWEAAQDIENIESLNKKDRETLLTFRKNLLKLMESTRDSSITEILYMSLELTGYARRKLAMKDGAERHQNVRRLLVIARRFESRSPRGLSDFIAHLGEMKAYDRREGGVSRRDERRDAVRLMSVHRARETRSPIVFLADVSRPFGARGSMIAYDGSTGFSMRVRNAVTNEYESSISYKDITERVKYKSLDEERRLLRLALTRAEEHLVLVGRGGRPAENSWAGWIEESLEIGTDTPEGRISAFGVRADLVRNAPEETTPSREDALTVCVEYDHEPKQAADSDTRRAEAPDRLSVSRVLDYLECPARFLCSDLSEIPKTGEGQRASGMAADEFGHLVHDLLARLDFTKDVTEQIERLVAEKAPARAAESVLSTLKNFASSRWCGELSAADRVLKEIPFEMKISGTVVAGRLDVLYHNENGWTILDYKTGKAEDRERYELQVGMYAHVISELTGEMPSTAALLLLSIGEEWVCDVSSGEAADSAKKNILDTIDSIEKEKFGPRPGPWCKWCGLSGRMNCTTGGNSK